MPSRTQIYNMEVAVGMNGSKLFSQAKKISSAVKSIGSGAKIDTSMSQKEMRNLDKSIMDTEKTIERLRRKQESLRKQNVNTAQYKQLQKEVAKAEQELSLLHDMQQNWNSTPEMASQIQADIDEAAQKVAYLKDEMASIEQYGTTDAAAESMRHYEDSITTAEASLESLNAQRDAQGDAVAPPPESAWTRFKNTLGRVAQKAGAVGAKLGEIVAGKVRAGIKALGKHFAQLTGKIFGVGKALNKMKRGLMMGMGIKGLARLGLMGALVYNGVRAIKAGFEDLAQYSPSVNKSISALLSSLTQLRNAMTAAFAPILSAIMPALTVLTNGLIKAATAVAHFFSALTGKNSVVVARKVSKDYAAGLKEAGKSADKANKKQKKLNDNLQSFDKINKLTKDKNANGGNGNKGDTGNTGLTPAQMFRTTKVAGWAKRLVKILKKAWKRGDFTRVGKMVGALINKSLKKIPWNEIKATAEKIGKSVATFINGAVGTIDWPLFGKTIAEGLNTVVTLFETFVNKVKWKDIGRAVSNSLAGIFTNIDYKRFGKLLVGVATGAFDLLTGFIEETDWSSVGKSFVKGLKSFGGSLGNGSAADVAAAWYEFYGACWGALTGFIFGGVVEALNFKKIWERIKKHFEKWISASNSDNAFVNVGLGIWAGITFGIIEGITGIRMWIKTHVTGPFIKGFKKAFGIGSPARKMMPLGKNIVLGVFKGAEKAVKKVFDWFKKLPKNIIKEMTKGAEESADTLTGWFADIPKNIQKELEKLGEASIIVNATAKLVEWSDALKDKVVSFKAKMSSWSDSLSSKVIDFKAKMETWTDSLKNKVLAFKAKMSSWYNAIKANKLVMGFKAKVKSWINAIKPSKLVLNMKAKVVGFIGKASTALKKFFGLAEGGVNINGTWRPVTAAAGGGSFNQGQMFVAREAGPELVGNIGGHTGVMNNNQIVASVSDGVYKAVVAAMSQNHMPVVLQGDAAKFFRVMQGEARSYTMSTGQPAFPV